MTALEPESRPKLGRGVRLRTDPITGEPLLLYPEGVLPLDETTHEIVTRCTGEATFESIVQSLANDYDADVETIRQDAHECLDQLRRHMLIALAP